MTLSFVESKAKLQNTQPLKYSSSDPATAVCTYAHKMESTVKLPRSISEIQTGILCIVLTETNFLSLITTLIICGYLSCLVLRIDNDFVILLKIIEIHNFACQIEPPSRMKRSRNYNFRQFSLRFVFAHSILSAVDKFVLFTTAHIITNAN